MGRDAASAAGVAEALARQTGNRRACIYCNNLHQ
jgi:hypothetical protein